MGKFFIPMYRYTTAPYQTKRPHRGFDNCAERVYDQPLLFDALMASLLGQLCNQPRGESCQKSSVGKQPRSPWIYGVNFKGFNPEDISVKVKNGQVHISARQVEKCESGYDTLERFRKVHLPKDVDDEKLSCFSEENGKLILTVPYIEQKHSVENKHESLVKLDTSSSESEKSEIANRKDNADVFKVPIEHLDTENNSQANSADTDSEQIIGSVEMINKEGVEETTEKKIQDSSKSDDGDKMNFDLPTVNNIEIENHEDNGIAGDQNCEERFQVKPIIMDDKQKNQVEIQERDKQNYQIVIEPAEFETGLSLVDSTMVKELNGSKQFEMNLNLHGFKPESTKIHWKNDTLHIDAEKEVKTESFVSYQKVQRKLSIPKSCEIESSIAKMNKGGLLKISVPMKAATEV